MASARTEDEEIRLRNLRWKRIRENLAWVGTAALIGLGALLAIYNFANRL